MPIQQMVMPTVLYTSYSAADSDAKQLYTLHTVVHSTCCDGIYCILEGHLNK